nr:MAG TPA: hypothetical protein [Caudoviricetes sp.]
MATNVVYNVFNGDDCAFESMTKEQIYELIANSIAQGELAGVDAENPFITRIKEQNKGVPLTFWVGTQAEFNAIETKANNCFYIITDSTAQQDIENALADLQQKSVASEPILNFASQLLLFMTEDWCGATLYGKDASQDFDLAELTDYRVIYYADGDFSQLGYKTIVGAILTDPEGVYVLGGNGNQDAISITLSPNKIEPTTATIKNNTEKNIYVALIPYTTYPFRALG